jgi:hypothetical protein
MHKTRAKGKALAIFVPEPQYFCKAPLRACANPRWWLQIPVLPQRKAMKYEHSRYTGRSLSGDTAAADT